MRIRCWLVAVLMATGAGLLHPTPVEALHRCASADPFTPAFKADVAARFSGHHITATAYDTRSGCTWRLNPGQQVTTASVVKVEVGAGVLLRAQRQGRGLTAGEQSRLWPMITESANTPTTELWNSLGGAPAMASLDRTFGLTSTTPSSPYWGVTSTTADDQVHLLRQVVLGEGGILDSAHRAPLVQAMGSVVPSQRWGVTAGTPPGTVVRQKNGFASSACCSWRVNSVGVIEHVGGPVVLAVLSDRWASMAQGIPAVEMVSRAVNESIVRSRPTEGAQFSGDLDVFKRGTDNTLWHRKWHGGWSVWVSLGGVLTSEPAATFGDNNRIDVFVRGADDGLWHRSWNGSWSGWVGLGGVLTSDPVAVSRSDNRIDVFARGVGDGLWHKSFKGSWSGWASLGGVLKSAPGAAAASRDSDRIDVFARGTDDGLWHRSLNGSWSGWGSLGGVLKSAPSAVSWGRNRVDLFVQGHDDAMWHRWWDGSWSGWESLGGVLTTGPGATARAHNRIDVFVKGTDQGTWHKWWNGTWGPWANLGWTN